MQMPGRVHETFGQSMRPHVAFHPDYVSSACLSTPSKPSTGKSFTIDALLARPDHMERERTNLYRNVSSQPPVSTTAVPFASHVYSQIPQFAYNQGIMHTQTGYPVFCYPPYNYQTTCRGAMYAQGMYFDTKRFLFLNTFQPKEKFRDLTKAPFYHAQMLYSQRQESTLSINTKLVNPKECAPVSPTNSCPDWRRNLHASSIWWDQSVSSWRLLSSSLKHR